MIKSAEFSPDRFYRYQLLRLWEPKKKYAMFIGLNPSTADETTDDRTIARCIQYAHAWGWGGLCMTNLFAFRATDPKAMKAEPNPIGQQNDEWIKSSAFGAGVIVAAWGTHGTHLRRDKHVRALLISPWLPSLHALRVTKGGHPQHPLYLPKDLKPKIFI